MSIATLQFSHSPWQILTQILHNPLVHKAFYVDIADGILLKTWRGTGLKSPETSFHEIFLLHTAFTVSFSHALPWKFFSVEYRLERKTARATQCTRLGYGASQPLNRLAKRLLNSYAQGMTFSDNLP